MLDSFRAQVAQLRDELTARTLERDEAGRTLANIADMPNESNEWEGVEFFETARRHAQGALATNGRGQKVLNARLHANPNLCPYCGFLYIGRGGQDGLPKMLNCANGHTWQDIRPDVDTTPPHGGSGEKS
jgi:hypothetical protein